MPTTTRRRTLLSSEPPRTSRLGVCPASRLCARPGASSRRTRAGPRHRWLPPETIGPRRLNHTPSHQTGDRTKRGNDGPTRSPSRGARLPWPTRPPCRGIPPAASYGTTAAAVPRPSAWSGLCERSSDQGTSRHHGARYSAPPEAPAPIMRGAYSLPPVIPPGHTSRDPTRQGQHPGLQPQPYATRWRHPPLQSNPRGFGWARSPAAP